MSNSNQGNRPLQSRARLTRRKILDATLELLEIEGIDKISTNAIARQAGVNIASLYKYFPDKYAVLHELAEEFGQRQADLICGYLAVTDIDNSIEVVCSGIVDAVIEGTRGGKALVQLQRSLIASPQLLAIYRKTNHAIGESLKPFLEHWGIDLQADQLELTMLCLGEAFSALQDLALSRDPHYDQSVVNELKFMLSAYYRMKLQCAEMP
ncbi:MAG: AcrR family transcriptional regulator [Planctomycetota bacterium]|jgi:AcrR family transcriptional regulator